MRKPLRKNAKAADVARKARQMERRAFLALQELPQHERRGELEAWSELNDLAGHVDRLAGIDTMEEWYEACRRRSEAAKAVDPRVGGPS